MKKRHNEAIMILKSVLVGTIVYVVTDLGLWFFNDPSLVMRAAVLFSVGFMASKNASRVKIRNATIAGCALYVPFGIYDIIKLRCLFMPLYWQVSSRFVPKQLSAKDIIVYILVYLAIFGVHVGIAVVGGVVELISSRRSR